MAGFVSQQPNGLYCRFSTVVDCLTHINMTKEDYLNNVTGTVPNKTYGSEVLEDYLKPFSWVSEYFVPNNMTQHEFNDFLVTMCSKPEGKFLVL